MRWLKIVIVLTCVCSCQKTIEMKIIKSSNSWKIEVAYRRVYNSIEHRMVTFAISYEIHLELVFYPTQPIIINWCMCAHCVQCAMGMMQVQFFIIPQYFQGVHSIEQEGVYVSCCCFCHWNYHWNVLRNVHFLLIVHHTTNMDDSSMSAIHFPLEWVFRLIT